VAFFLYIWFIIKKALAFSSGNEDTLLLSLVSRGNEEAFRKLFDRFSGIVYHKAFHILKSPVLAEDVIQEVFIKLWLNRTKMEEIRDIKAYLSILTRNHIFNMLRKQAYHDQLVEELSQDRHADTATALETLAIKDLHERIIQIVTTLPPQRKRVYELSRSEGLKNEEIARTLGISAETVKKHLSEAMKTLRNKLSGFRMMIFLLTLAPKEKK